MTVKPLQTIVFLFGLHALASATRTLPESSLCLMAAQEEEHDRKSVVRKRGLRGEAPSTPKTRRLKSQRNSGGDGNNGGGVGGRSGYGSCTTLASVGQHIIDSTRTRDPADACLTENACNTGCCRIHNRLVCDKDEAFGWLECVCNNGAAQPGLGINVTNVTRVEEDPSTTPISFPVPFASDACVDNENTNHAELTAQGVNFTACEHSDECTGNPDEDCCGAPAFCMCMPWKISHPNWCVWP